MNQHVQKQLITSLKKRSKVVFKNEKFVMSCEYSKET